MTDHWSVVLNDVELRICAWVGRQRRQCADASGSNPGLGPSRVHELGVENHIRGAECEYACSRILNLYWRPWVASMAEAKRMRDVGGLIEVRSTDLARGRLIVKPDDPDDAPFALIVRKGNRFTLAGWLFAYEAKQFDLLTGFGDPAHFVPQDKLSPNALLADWVHSCLQESA